MQRFHHSFILRHLSTPSGALIALGSLRLFLKQDSKINLNPPCRYLYGRTPNLRLFRHFIIKPFFPLTILHGFIVMHTLDWIFPFLLVDLRFLSHCGSQFIICLRMFALSLSDWVVDQGEDGFLGFDIYIRYTLPLPICFSTTMSESNEKHPIRMSINYSTHVPCSARASIGQSTAAAVLQENTTTERLHDDSSSVGLFCRLEQEYSRHCIKS